MFEPSSRHAHQPSNNNVHANMARAAIVAGIVGSLVVLAAILSGCHLVASDALPQRTDGTLVSQASPESTFQTTVANYNTGITEAMALAVRLRNAGVFGPTDAPSPSWEAVKLRLQRVDDRIETVNDLLMATPPDYTAARMAADPVEGLLSELTKELESL